jgi:hypothetical protein
MYRRTGARAAASRAGDVDVVKWDNGETSKEGGGAVDVNPA